MCGPTKNIHFSVVLWLVPYTQILVSGLKIFNLIFGSCEIVVMLKKIFHSGAKYFRAIIIQKNCIIIYE